MQVLKQSSKYALLVFLSGSLTDTEKGKKILDTYESFHSPDIPRKMLKQNVGFFSTFVLGYMNKSTTLYNFPGILKLEGITPRSSRPS